MKEPKSTTLDGTNIAVAYLRVSTQMQEEKGYSLENQKEKALEYAEKEGLILHHNMIFTETEPASTINNTFYPDNIYDNLSNRPKLQHILQLARRKKISHLITYTRDRLARDLDVFIGVTMELKRKEVSVHFCKDGEIKNEKGNVYSQFLDIVLASIAEYEANVIASRVKLGGKSNILDGYWAGGKEPFGYYLQNRYQKNKKTYLKTIPYEKCLVQEVFECYVYLNLTYQQIADRMNAKYWNSRNWTKSKVESIIKNETYTGTLVWNRRGSRRNPHNDEPLIKSKPNDDIKIIEATTWKASENIRDRKAKDAKYFDTPFLLKDKLICGKCGSIMRCKDYGKNKRAIYRCPSSNDGISELIIKKNHIEELFTQEFTQIINSPHRNAEILLKDIENITNVKKNTLENAIQNLKGKIGRIEDLRNKTKAFLDNIYDNPDNEFKSYVEEHFITLLQESNHLKIIRDRYLEKYSSMKIPTRDQLQNYISDTVHRFNSLSSTNQRILIEMLIDRVSVTESLDGTLAAKIIVRFSID